MTLKSVAVIGANFGDEGKGLITDFETRRLGAKYVARCNGGAQAGHTVVTSDGDRHVFGHHGAGTFAGANTYLSSQFLVNPLVFAKERAVLGDKATAVYVDCDARVSTIYDMMINNLAELNRGGGRHGSCGLGINETVTRDAAGFGLRFYDLRFERVQTVAALLKRIHKYWVPRRLLELELSFENVPSNLYRSFFKIMESENYEAKAQMLLDSAADMIVGRPEPEVLVIEGAQGLALDEELGMFPHVTRSITGLKSAVGAAYELGMDSVTPVYVTRSYLTRHGAGPLEHEGEAFTSYGQDPFDQTNIPNNWQGTLRYAPLNLPQLKDFIDRDYARGLEAAFANIDVHRPHIAVTCLDQVGDSVTLIGLDGNAIVVPVQNAAQFIASELKLELSHSSRGPRAEDVQFHTMVL